MQLGFTVYFSSESEDFLPRERLRRRGLAASSLASKLPAAAISLPARASCVEPQAPSHTPHFLALVSHTPNPSKATSMVCPCSCPPLPPALGKPPRCLYQAGHACGALPAERSGDVGMGGHGGRCWQGSARHIRKLLGSHRALPAPGWAAQKRAVTLPPKRPWPSAGTR